MPLAVGLVKYGATWKVFTGVLWVAQEADPMLCTFETTCVLTFMATRVHTSILDGFLVQGGTPPFLPRPLGMVEVTRAVIIGLFFFFFTAEMNSST